MESRALLNLEVIPNEIAENNKFTAPNKYNTVENYQDASTYTSIYSKDPNGFVRDSVNGLVYLPDANESSEIPGPLDQPKSTTSVVDQTIMTGITLERLFKNFFEAKMQFCDLRSRLLVGSYFRGKLEDMDTGCSRCSDSQKNRTAFYRNKDAKVFYQGTDVENLIDVNYCTYIFAPTPAPLEDDFRYDCYQNLCSVPAKQLFKSTSNNEKSAKCTTFFSMIVGLKTSLEICKK